jgi:hypothetical protein
VLLVPKGVITLATPLGSVDLAILTDLFNFGDMSQCEIHKNNVIDFTDEELSTEDRQDIEDFMKQRVERDHQEVEKLMKEKAENEVKKIKDFTTCCTSRRIMKARLRRSRTLPSTLHRLRYHPM